MELRVTVFPQATATQEDTQLTAAGEIQCVMKVNGRCTLPISHLVRVTRLVD
jgi:hypothetical protein